MNPRTASDHRAYVALCNAHNVMLSSIPAHWGFAKAAAKSKGVPYGAKYREPAQMLERHEMSYSYAYALTRAVIDMAEKIREIREGEKARPVLLKDGRFLFQKYSDSADAFKLAIRLCGKASPDIRIAMHLGKTTVSAPQGAPYLNAFVSPAWKHMTDKLGGVRADKRFVILHAQFAFAANGHDFFRASVLDVRSLKYLEGYVGRYKQDGEETRMMYHDSPTRCVTRLTTMVAKMAFEKMMPTLESN